MAKKVVMIIAKANFRDEELLEPKAILEQAGIEVTIASSSKDTATGMLGAQVEPDIIIDEVDINNYNVIIFVGGNGASEYWDSPVAHTIAKQAIEQGKLVCAICIAPVTLARAGVLSGKKATVWSSEIRALGERGALYTGQGVQRDGNIITASGPTYAKEFGKAILEALKD